MSADRHTFPKSLRLTKPAQFQYVYEARVRINADPLLIHSRPNDLSHCRLGLAVNRRVGGAVVRNRLKRQLREAFRTRRHAWPGAYDLVISAKRHEALTVDAYRALLDDALEKVHEKWTRKVAKAQLKGIVPPPAPPPAPPTPPSPPELLEPPEAPQ